MRPKSREAHSWHRRRSDLRRAVIVFGRGGTAAEIINDKALALPPLDLQLASDLIERTRVSRLLRAYRNVPAVRKDVVATILVKAVRRWRQISGDSRTGHQSPDRR